jgi:hypothetical protein
MEYNYLCSEEFTGADEDVGVWTRDDCQVTHSTAYNDVEYAWLTSTITEDYYTIETLLHFGSNLSSGVSDSECGIAFKAQLPGALLNDYYFGLAPAIHYLTSLIDYTPLGAIYDNRITFDSTLNLTIVVEPYLANVYLNGTFKKHINDGSYSLGQIGLVCYYQSADFYSVKINFQNSETQLITDAMNCKSFSFNHETKMLLKLVLMLKLLKVYNSHFTYIHFVLFCILILLFAIAIF